MLTIFISYKSEDIQYVHGIKSIAKNKNNLVEFIDSSLPEPVENEYGHVITKPPSDPDASQVRNEIYALLEQSNKLLVVVGENTHSSKWVEWEIKQFKKMQQGSMENILLIRHRNNDFKPGMPNYIGDAEIHDWDKGIISDFLT